MNSWSSIFSEKTSSFRNRSAFLVAVNTSFLIGSIMHSKSFFILVIKVPLLLFTATFSSRLTAVVTSCFISFVKAFHAVLFAADTSFFASFSSDINSWLSSTNFRIFPFPSSYSKFRIHSCIFSMQSNSFSHFNCSIFL